MWLLSGYVLRPVNRCASAVSSTSLIKNLCADSSNSSPAEESGIVVGLAKADRMQKASACYVHIRVRVADFRNLL